MAIQFIGGIIRISRASTTMRSFLSISGQTTYDSTIVGNFFSCSLADYTAVFNGYADAAKIGNTDTQFNTSVNSSYTATCASILPSENSTIPANTYILGFATKMLTNLNFTVTPLISTTYAGTYAAISNSPTMVGNTGVRYYFLRKDPPITSVTSYVGHVASNGTFDQATNSYTNARFDCSSPYSTWTTRTATMPNFQMFVTTTKPY